MSLSGAPIPPMIHHFYPIHPQTALQQQSAVYSTSDNPLVAPILATPSQPFRNAHGGNHQKRKIQQVDSETEYLGSRPSGSHSRRTRHSRKPRSEPSHEISDSPAIRLGPRHQRRVAYVELPPHNSFDLTMYRPVTLASLRMQLHLNQFDRDNRAREYSLGHQGESISSAASSTASEYTVSSDFSYVETRRQSRGKMAGPKLKSDADGATCHQCRRKTTKEKMRCRTLRPNGSVCPLLYCNYCIAVRYDDVFNSSHPSWRCPHCRGICNCSICLRKAGFGYVLDGSISEQLTGVQGRLSVGYKKIHAPSGKVMKAQGDEQNHVSVRAWLARKGIAVGTEEWIGERRRQGVRFVVGKSPPPPDGPSPYKEAQFNPTLQACTDYFEEQEDGDTSISARVSRDDGDTTMSPAPICKGDDATGLPPMRNHRPLPPDVRFNSNAIPGTASAHCHEELGLHPFSSQSSDVDASALSTSNEDLPGLSSPLTYSLRLVVGKSLSGAKRQKRQLATLNSKQNRPTKAKKRVEGINRDFEDVDQTQQRKVLPDIPVLDDGLRDAGVPVKAIQNQLNEEEGQGEQQFISGMSTISDTPHSPHRADRRSTPVPPHEPVLVPTERYVPSKLDVTMAKDSQMEVGQTYWSFNAVTPRETEHKQEHDHGRPSLSTPLYSNNDRHLSPQFSPEDGNPIGPSLPESVAAVASAVGSQQTHSESTSSSKSRTLDDYLNLNTHVQANGDDAYLMNSLAALDETWASIDMAPYPTVENDMSPLQP